MTTCDVKSVVHSERIITNFAAFQPFLLMILVLWHIYCAFSSYHSHQCNSLPQLAAVFSGIALKHPLDATWLAQIISYLYLIYCLYQPSAAYNTEMQHIGCVEILSAPF